MMTDLLNQMAEKQLELARRLRLFGAAVRLGGPDGFPRGRKVSVGLKGSTKFWVSCE